MNRLDDLFRRALLLLNSIGTVWIFILMIVIVTDVIGRTVFTRPLPGVPELVSISIIGIVFLQIGQALRSGRITRVDTLLGLLDRRVPKLSALLQGFYGLLGMALFIALFNACLPLFLRAWQNGDYVGVEGYITYPVWPVRLFMLIGCVGAAIQYVLFAARDFARAFHR
jgi:TRAP-type C4-dicarboxylate transport system permease small subunit